MSTRTTSSSPVAYFCYAVPRGFSGQREATEIVLRGLRERGWRCHALPLPVLEREDRPLSALGRYVIGLAGAWLRCLRLVAGRGGWLCANVGQTPASFLRDALPLALGRLVLGRSRVVVSLHGSLFMAWPQESARARWFRLLLAQAGLVTVLGEGQRRRLLAWGLAPSRVEVVVNTCAVEPVAASECKARWSGAPGQDRPLRLLHLSSLISSKGFPAYLESLAALAEHGSVRIEAVLCGRLVAGGVEDRFADTAEAERWIEATVERINRTRRVRVRWVRGAVGADKAALFREADVFVFPSRYAVEAQPIVLLEAMASGCAIISTSVGEIRTILGEDCACFLAAADPAGIRDAVLSLAADPSRAAQLAAVAHRRFVERYQLNRLVEAWALRLSGTALLPVSTEAPAFRET